MIRVARSLRTMDGESLEKARALQYSFDLWNQPAPPDLPAETEQTAQAAFPFSRDLEELEASLSMNREVAAQELQWHYGEERWPDEAPPAYPQAPDFSVGPGPEIPPEASGPAPAQEWDELADTVASYVMAYMQTSTQPATHEEVHRWQAMAQEYHADNRLMAAQLQRLLSEKDELTRRLAGYEIELARYRSIAGNIYLKW